MRYGILILSDVCHTRITHANFHQTGFRYMRVCVLYRMRSCKLIKSTMSKF